MDGIMLLVICLACVVQAIIYCLIFSYCHNRRRILVQQSNGSNQQGEDDYHFDILPP